MVQTLPSNAWCVGSLPGRGIKIPRAKGCSQNVSFFFLINKTCFKKEHFIKKNGGLLIYFFGYAAWPVGS